MLKKLNREISGKYVQGEVDVCNNTDSTCCAEMIPPLWQTAPPDKTYQRRKTQVIHENDY